MIGSGIIDVGIGIVLIFVLISLICSTITEGISQFLALRSNNLERGISNLLKDPDKEDIANKFYEHPLISGLAKTSGVDNFLNKISAIFKKGADRYNKPAYITSRTFSLALLDIVTDSKGMLTNDKLNKLKIENQGNENQGNRNQRNGLQGNEELHKILRLLISDTTNLETAQKNVERWYDDAMDRVSSWYKRKAQFIILLVSALVVVALNADIFRIANYLWTDTGSRDALVSAAQQVSSTDQLKAITDQLGGISLPLGWSDFAPFDYGVEVWIEKVAGLVFMALAVSLGAPFWFDILSKVMRIRSSLKPSEEDSAVVEQG